MPAPFPVFVVHHPALRERAEHCLRSFRELGWSARFVAPPGALGLGWAFVRRVRNPRLTLGQVSVALAQLSALRSIAEDAAPAGFVLEDDPVFEAGFRERFLAALGSLPPDFDLVFFGASCGLEAAPEDAQAGYGRASGTRSMSGYLVSRSAAARLVSALEFGPITRTIDITVNQLIQELGLRVYWSVPALIPNGTETGLFPTSVRGGRLRRSAWVQAALRRLLP
jgi:GR25 family glycosyltransferase involved in LPS biosynthesis